MELKALFEGDQFKTFRVRVAAGDRIPRHQATEDAYLVVVQGLARLQFDHSELMLQQGSATYIPPQFPHQLDVIEDLTAYLFLAADGDLDFLEHGAEQLLEQASHQ